MALVLANLICAGTGQAQHLNAVAVPNPPQVAEALPREREIWLRHHWTGETLKVVYRIGDAYQPQALAAINWLLRDYRCNQVVSIDPKLIDLLYELAQELRPRGPVRVISGYRSEGYNASLLRAGRTVDPDSQHTLGHAVDVIFPGVKPDRVRAAAEARGLGGVGFYPFSGPIFVHVDTGPVRHWAERDPKLRRALGVARRRTRLALDCALTTEKVLEEIPAEQAYAALPPGASTRPYPEAKPPTDDGPAGGSSEGDSPALGNAAGDTLSSAEHEDGPACRVEDSLSRLSLLPDLSRAGMASRRPLLRKKANRQLKRAARSAGLVSRRAPGKSRSGRKK